MKINFRSSYLQLLALACSILTLAPTALHAQFKQPSPEELSMTADPKAPGAAAVYLNYSDETDDEMHVRTISARIKVLTEKGKEYATVDIYFAQPFMRVDDIKARTIHSDGTVIPLDGKPDELLAVKTGENRVDHKVFNLPSVEVGSIIEYRYKLRNDDRGYTSPHWEIQHPLFVHQAHYSFIPFRDFQKNRDAASGSYLVNSKGEPLRLVSVTKLPQGTELKTDVKGTYSLDLSDIPASPNEDFRPPDRTIQYRVEFYYTSAHNAKDFWNSETSAWSKDVDHFADHDNTLKGIAASLVASTDSDLVKAQKFYKAVQALDNTDFSRVKSQSELRQLGIHQAKRAEDTWNQKSGSREDITLLYLALLRSSGIHAYDMKVVNRNQGTFDYTYFTMQQLDDDLVLAKIDGKETLLDPGEKMCPFGLVNWMHSGATGIRQSDAGPVTATTPMSSYKDNTLSRSGDLTLDETGSISGTINYAMNGQRALHWRQLALRNDVDEVKLQFDNELNNSAPKGVEAHVDHFINLDNPDTALFAVVKVHGAYGNATQKRLLLPGYFFNSRTSHTFVDQPTRQTPVDMSYAEQISDKILLHLPQHFKIETAPPPTSESWAGHAILAAQIKADDDTVASTRTLARAFTLAKPEEYQDLHNFYLKVATSDQQQLTLVRSDSSVNTEK